FKVNITDIKIRRIYQDKKLKALVSITIDDQLAVHDIKVVQGPERVFIAMPSRREENGRFRDVVHPINVETRNMLEELILGTYFQYIEEHDISLYEEEVPPQEV
uniref:septation regulator SpoVG n=1 Tax=Candidatus Soleaferrea massiliensis TaxID=1470354 RepID=UPI002A4E18D0